MESSQAYQGAVKLGISSIEARQGSPVRGKRSKEWQCSGIFQLFFIKNKFAQIPYGSF